jgi:small subunit ribosomal protein S9
MAKAEPIHLRQKINKNYVSSVGRRREAVARVRLYTQGNKVELNGIEVKKGETYVNGKLMAEYFRFITQAPVYNKFLLESGISGKHFITAKVAGGGNEAQLDALILGVARALDKFDTNTFHSILREKGYLTRDPRTRERRKVGNAGKARRKKSSPKR